MQAKNTSPHTKPHTKPSKPTKRSGWLQTWVVTGSLAATVVAAGLISRLEQSKNAGSVGESSSTTTTDQAVPNVALSVLEPIPTLVPLPTASLEDVVLPTPTPDMQTPVEPSAGLMPTDTPAPTVTPVPTVTPIVRQQATSPQSSFAPRARSRSRSSR